MRTQINIPADNRPSARRQRVFARAAGAGFDVRAAGSVTEIGLYDEIGVWGVSAAAFRERLASITGDIKLKINSPGGDVFDGIAMHNDLVAHRGNVQVEVTGVAASAASIVAMAGTEIAIASNAFVMIHRAWGVTVGNTANHTEMAGLLSQIDASLSATYAARTGQDRSAIDDWMAAETWFGAEAAVDAGFADEIIDEGEDQSARAAFNLDVYAKVPSALKSRPAAATDFKSKLELELILRGANVSRSRAKAVASAYFAAAGHTAGPTADDTEITQLMDRIAKATAAWKGK